MCDPSSSIDGRRRDGMQVRLLGAVDVQVGGELRVVPGLRRKAILSVLALKAGQTVSADELIDLAWGDRATAVGPNTVQSHVSYLRQRLGKRSAIVTRTSGYVLEVPGDASDAAAAERLIRGGLQAADPAHRAGLLSEALGRWRGQPLQDVLGVPWLAGQAHRLATMELEARRALIEVRLSLGEHAQLVPELRLLAAQHPVDEQVQAQLVLALYRTGRQADALAVLRDVRRFLAAELGIDPGQSLRDLEASVLRQDPGLTPSRERIDIPATAPSGHVESAPPFVGRQAELARFSGLLDAAGSGAAHVVEVVGEPGIGKSRLLAEVAVQARRSGWTVLSGRAAEFEQQVPFGVVADALRDHPGLTAPAGLGLADRELLLTVFPALAATPPGGDADREHSEPVRTERYRLYRGVSAMLTTLAGADGLFLILDDLHWADEGTAELTEFLLRHRPRGRVLVAVAHRPRQTPAAVRRALARPEVAVVELGPLAAPDADRLLPPGIDATRREQLHTAGAGNPFYLLALAAHREPGSPAVGGLAGPATAGTIPEAVRAALTAEFGSLSARQTLVAQGAAVAGDGVHAGLIARTAGLALDAVLADLDELARRDLIRADRSGRFRFRHPLVRRIGYDLTGAGWRVAAHARAAAALRDGGATAAEIAVHVEHSAEPADPEAVAVLRDAAADAMLHSPAVAAHRLSVALRLAPATPESILIRLDLLTMRARAFGLSGRLMESRNALHDLRRLLPAELDEQHAQIATFCATIERLIGRHAEARAQLLTELRAQPDQHSGAALALKLGLATGVVMRADREPRHDWPAEALTTARHHGERVPTAWALAMCVVTDHMAGRVDERTAARLDEATRLVDALPDGDLAETLEPIMWLGSAEICQERLDDAIRHLHRALAIARAAGQDHCVAFVHAMLGAAHLLLGDLDRAAVHLADQLDAAYLTDSAELRSFALRNQCWLALARGDTEAALHAGKEALACADAEKDRATGEAAGTLGVAHLLAGDPATAIDLMVSGGGGADLWRVDPFERANWYESLASAEAARGRAGEAAGWADRAFANAAGLPRRTGLAHLARAHALSSTDPVAAVGAALRGADLLRGAGDRIMAGRAHLLAGRLVAEPDHAREQFAVARELFEACGATGHLELAGRVSPPCE
jgi:DNA-binding SARP family transcriptional activator/tetratricopeptide (TPR) repeat protein